MKELRIEVDVPLAEDLEAWFCEDYQEYWMLREDWKTGVQTLCGFFSDSATGEGQLAELRARFPQLPASGIWLDVEDRDWREAYKIHFKPWSERGLHWVPVWEREQYRLPPGDAVVYLDPGMAFGTGNHETTRLCVRRLLDARDDWGKRVAACSVIDAGCGSGILAISAAKLGFGSVYGFDNDPDAVSISRDNEKLCALEGKPEWSWADLNDGLHDRSSDILMANILAPILIDHAGLLCGAVRPGGRLILSGILTTQLPGVIRTFHKEAVGMTRSDSRQDGEWSDLCIWF